jgi:very-short-patch-repair endonuclease
MKTSNCNDNSKDLRETLLDDKKFLDLAEEFIECGGERYSTEKPEFTAIAGLAVDTFNMLAAHNDAIIRGCSESKIELLFFRAVQLRLSTNFVPVVITPSLPDSEREIARIGKVAVNASAAVSFMVEKLGPVEAGKHFFSVDDWASKLYFSLSLLCNPAEVVHISLQAILTDVRVNGKKVRADALVWSPIKKQRYVIECDGFQFHSSKERFTNDRQRDRALQLANYKILRFSGSEIYNDPIKASADFMEAIEPLLRGRRKKRKDSAGKGFGGAS